MNIKLLVEKIEERMTNFSKYPVYDGLTYKLCRAFQDFYITGLIGKKAYNKYISDVLDVQNKIFEHYKHDNTSVTEDDRNTFFSIIWK